MRLPENDGRLFVGGIALGTADADLHRHFCRYGTVAEICQPKDRLTGLPRGFAFVQFPCPTDAGRALADPHHVINGQKVRVARAKPRTTPYKPVDQRIFWVGKHGYRVGDVVETAFGPLVDNYEECEYVNKLRKFGAIVDKMLVFECVIGYVSEDGKECLLRWPPLKRGGKKFSPSLSGQGNFIPASALSLKDLAQSASNGNPDAATAHSRSCYPGGGSVVGHEPSSAEQPTYSPKAEGGRRRSQNRGGWLVFRGLGY